MELELYGRAIYLVHSHGETFTVDVLCNNGSGSCDCVHFKTRIKPVIAEAKLKGTFDPNDPRHKCPHIVASDRALLSMFKSKLMEQFPDNENEI